ncbi:MAG: response regulator transcription factor [Ktedonobacteraceae bacterium]
MPITPKVLIIDDSATSSLFMSTALRRAGYSVSTAVNGDEGIAKALQERPHCLLLDVVLPGASGFSICRKLRSMDPYHTLSIIIVSSKNTKMDLAWGLRQGADRYLPKPFSEETLLQTVAEVLSQRHRA